MLARSWPGAGRGEAGAGGRGIRRRPEFHDHAERVVGDLRDGRPAAAAEVLSAAAGQEERCLCAALRADGARLGEVRDYRHDALKFSYFSMQQKSTGLRFDTQAVKDGFHRQEGHHLKAHRPRS